MHAGSTPKDVHRALKRPPFVLLDGDYVRAEATPLFAAELKPGSKGASAKPQHERGAHRTTLQIRKADAITPNLAVLRIMTNKRSQG